MTISLGLTGSIGMGKSTTAQMFVDLGLPLWDADAAVHHLYAKGGAAVQALGAVFPEAIINGAVSRDRLKQIIGPDAAVLKQIENIVHPLVAADRAAFLAQTDADIAVLDIPLLFETGADKWIDVIVVVTAPEAIQHARVLAREGMTQKQLELILSRQLPDAEKRARADYVIETVDMDATRRGVQNVVTDIRKTLTHA